MRDPIENISKLQKQLNDLQLENQILKNILDQAGVSYKQSIARLKAADQGENYDPEQGKRIIHPDEITDEMANNFFARFWGRQDVYAKRNEKEDILAHLRGNAYNASDVIGVYPLLKNNICRFLVFDFDNHEKNAEENDFANVDDAWIEEVEAMRNICVLNGIDPLVERSRSGRGAHIWIFFDKPIPASLARRFGTALLDRGAECVNLKSFQYYDRMLPAQDKLPEGGLGNLIALPLQGKALRNGNSAFVDSNWNAYREQWEVLWSKPKLSQEFLELKIKEWSLLLGDTEESGQGESREKPWEQNRKFVVSDVAGKLSITLSNGIYIDNTNVKATMQNKIRRMAAISNLVYFKNQAIGTSNYDTSRWIYLGADHLGGYIEIPRGLYDSLIDNLEQAHIEYEIQDERQAAP